MTFPFLTNHTNTFKNNLNENQTLFLLAYSEAFWNKYNYLDESTDRKLIYDSINSKQK